MIEDNYNYVNGLLGIDIAKKTRSIEYVEGRALFYALSLGNTKVSKRSIGEYVNKNHCAVIHAMGYTINALSDYRVISSYDSLIINKNVVPGNNRILFDKLNRLSAEQFKHISARIEAMLLMVGKEAEPIVIKEMEGAEL